MGGWNWKGLIRKALFTKGLGSSKILGGLSLTGENYTVSKEKFLNIVDASCVYGEC